MKYTTTIDNVKSLEWGLSLKEAYVFEFLYSVASWSDKQVIDGEVRYFASRNKAIEEVPIVTDKPDTMYRFYKSLEDKGLILTTKIGKKDYIMVTEKGMMRNKLGKKSEYSEKNPKKLGKKSEKDSENFPTNNNTIYNNINNNISNNIYIDFFEKFWDLYGYKKDRKNAEKAFVKILSKEKDKEATFNMIMEGTKKYKKYLKVTEQFQKHASGRLNAYRREDEYNIKDFRGPKKSSSQGFKQEGLPSIASKLGIKEDKFDKNKRVNLSNVF